MSAALAALSLPDTRLSFCHKQDMMKPMQASTTTAPSTYRLKAACNNCGLRAFYNVPKGAEFWPMDGESSIPHSYEPSFFEYRDESRKDATCSNCGTACLCIEYWDRDELKSPARGRKVAIDG